MNSLVVILGPTATGKSKLAVHLAQRLGGEIVGADSRQVYCNMDIGTAKPTPQEMALAPHHLIDIINPDENFSLAQYQRLAYQKIADIQQRQKLPLLVGGSGLYVWAVMEGWRIPEVAPDLEFRRHLEGRAERGEAGELYRELAHVDPEAAGRIDPRNVRRVIRALEIARNSTVETRHAVSLQKAPPPYKTLLIGLTAGRKELYRRIDARVDSMIEQGLIGEVKKLLETRYAQGLPSMSGIGYKQIILYLKGQLTIENAVQQIKTESHRLVRRQYNWFRLKDERIRWFDVERGETPAEVEGLVRRFSENGRSPGKGILPSEKFRVST